MEWRNILRMLGPWCAGKLGQVARVIQYESSHMTKLMLQLQKTQLCIVHAVVFTCDHSKYNTDGWLPKLVDWVHLFWSQNQSG